MNLGQLTNRVMDATLRGGALTGGNRDQVKEDINEAIKEVDAVLRPRTITSIENLIAGQADYSLVSDFGIVDCQNIRDITYTAINNTGIVTQLEPASPAYIREMRQSFTSSVWVNMWALDGLDTLLLYPTTQSVGDTVKIYYNPRPADLANETDVPVGLGAEWHDLYELAAIKRSMRQTSPEYAQMYYTMYEKRLDDYRKWRNRRDGAIPRRAVVGRPGRRLMPHDPSTDLGY